MNFLRLLSIGHSFVGAKHEPCRFIKLAPACRLPRFQSNDRPVVQLPRAEQSESSHRGWLSTVERLLARLAKSMSPFEKSRLESRLQAVGPWNSLKAGLQTRRTYIREIFQTRSKAQRATPVQIE